MANRVATVHVLSLWLVPFISSRSTKTWKSSFDHSSRTWIQIALNMLENFLNTSSWVSLLKWTTRCKSEREIPHHSPFHMGLWKKPQTLCPPHPPSIVGLLRSLGAQHFLVLLSLIKICFWWGQGGLAVVLLIREAWVYFPFPTTAGLRKEIKAEEDEKEVTVTPVFLTKWQSTWERNCIDSRSHCG